MKTLVCVEKQILYLPSPSPWNPKSSIFHPKTMETRNCPSRTRNLRAGPKGFSGTPAKETLARKNQRKTDDDNDEKIPDVVLERMIVRILFNVGFPLVMGIALLQFFDIVKEQKLLDVPRWVPFLTTLITFGGSALGVAYGALSTSWDEEKKGSILGFEEAQKNWGEVWKEEE